MKRNSERCANSAKVWKTLSVIANRRRAELMTGDTRRAELAEHVATYAEIGDFLASMAMAFYWQETDVEKDEEGT